MNRQTIVERAPYVLLLLLGFAVVYGLPMLGLSIAVEHGWFAAAGIAAVSFLRADPCERVVDVLDYHQHGHERCAMVNLKIDGGEPFECCVPVAELHIENAPVERPTPPDRRLAKFVERIVKNAPPLSSEQRDRITSLLQTRSALDSDEPVERSSWFDQYRQQWFNPSTRRWQSWDPFATVVRPALGGVA